MIGFCLRTSIAVVLVSTVASTTLAAQVRSTGTPTREAATSSSSAPSSSTPSSAAPRLDTSDDATTFFERLDRLYTWGALVEELRCRVHGRWLTFSPARPNSGQFWGTMTYRDGRLDFSVDRTLGPERPREEWRKTLHTLIEQAGLLPTGFPVPAVRSSESTTAPGASTRPTRPTR